MIRRLIAALIALAPASAWADSTIDITQPANGGGLTSSVVRQSFQSAANDINNILGMFYGTTAPSNPHLYQRWMNTSTSPAQIQVWNGTSWVSFSTYLNFSNPVYMPKLGLLAVTSPSATLDIQGNVTGTTPTIQQAISDTNTSYLANTLVDNQSGGSSPSGSLRETLHVEQQSAYASGTAQVVGTLSLGRIQVIRDGSGNIITAGGGFAYGINPACIVQAGAQSASECIGSEIDIQLESDAAAKIGQQIIDVGPSVGRGLGFDVGLLVSSHIGARGFERGIAFGSGVGSAGVTPTGTLIGILPAAFTGAPIAQSYGNGIDFTSASFSNYAWSSKGMLLQDNGTLSLGNQTTAANPVINFYSAGNATVTGQIGISNGGTLAASQMTFNSGAFQFNTGAIVANAGMSVGGSMQIPFATPTSSTASCSTGYMQMDAIYMYGCAATNHWKRVALTDF